MEIPYMLIRQIKSAASRNSQLASLIADCQYLQLQRRKKHLDRAMQQEIALFVDPSLRADEAYMRKLKRDILFSRQYYQTCIKEYFLFDFEKLSDVERREYIGWFELKQYYDRLNTFGRPEIFDSKERTYEVFKAFFHRDAILIQKTSEKDAFIHFVCSHTPCVMKRLLAYGGKGIRRIVANSEQTAAQLFEAFVGDLPFLLEEMIDQDPAMARFHSQSVNTIRYNTFFHDGKLTKLQAAIRMGRGGSFLDNATSGGIYALVDVDTGSITGPAGSEAGEVFYSHPDNGVQIAGSQIPRWGELNELLEEVVRVVPEQKQVGWDFALSRDGWILVEGNSFPAIQSFDWHHGMRKEITDAFGQVILVKYVKQGT